MRKAFVKTETADDGSNSSQCVTSSSPYASPSDTDSDVVKEFRDLNCGKHDSEPYLSILYQPQQMFRFRYVSEMGGTHGCLLAQQQNGRNKQRTYPTVELKNYNKEAIIRCQLWNHELDEEHPHRIQCGDSTEGVLHVEGTVGPEQFFPLSFPEMGIIYTGKKSVAEELFRRHYKPDMDVASEKRLKSWCDHKAKGTNLNIVRLKFTAHSPTDHSLICRPIFSVPIYNMKSAETNELKICRMDKFVGSAKGHEDIFILTEKVNKKNINVRFVEENEAGEEVWSKEAFFTQADVHHQYAIVFKTPPYRDPETPVDVWVWVELFRPSDGSTSARKHFKYKADPRHASKKRKFRGSGSELSSSESAVSLKSADIPLFVANLISQQTENVPTEPTFAELSVPPPEITTARDYISQLRPPAADEAGLGSALYLSELYGEPTLSPALQMPTAVSAPTTTYSGTATFVPSANASSEFSLSALITQGLVENSDDYRNALLDLSSDLYRDYVMEIEEQANESFSGINYKHLNPMKTDAAKKKVTANDSIEKRQILSSAKNYPESSSRAQPLRSVNFAASADLECIAVPQMDTEGIQGSGIETLKIISASGTPRFGHHFPKDFLSAPKAPHGDIPEKIELKPKEEDVVTFQSCLGGSWKEKHKTVPTSDISRLALHFAKDFTSTTSHHDASPEAIKVELTEEGIAAFHDIEGLRNETEKIVPTSDISRLVRHFAKDVPSAITSQQNDNPERLGIETQSSSIVQADLGVGSESVPMIARETTNRGQYTAKYDKKDGDLVNKESNDDALTDSDIPDVDMEPYIADLVKKYCEIIKNKALSNTQLGKRHLGEILQNIMVPRLSNGDTFLHMLVANQSTSMLDYMVRQMRFLNLRGLLDIPNRAGETVLHLSVLHHLPAVTSCLLSAGCSLTQEDNAGRTPLHIAAVQKDADCLRRLLMYVKVHHGYSVDPLDNEGMTPYLLAARYGVTGNMALLLDAGAAADARDANARHALHLVAAGDHLCATHIVLERLPPSEIDCVDSAGNTALQMVCSGGARPHTLAIAKLLCERGANVMKRSGGNSCPLRLASDNPQLLELLQRYASDEFGIKSEPEDEFDSAQEDSEDDDTFVQAHDLPHHSGVSTNIT